MEIKTSDLDRGLETIDVEGLKPLRHQVFIEPARDPEQIGSIIVPDAIKTYQPQSGWIVALGECDERLKIGDFVTFPRMAEHDQVALRQYDHRSKHLFVVSERNISCVIMDWNTRLHIRPLADRIVVQAIWEYQDVSDVLFTPRGRFDVEGGRMASNARQHKGLVRWIGDSVKDRTPLDNARRMQYHVVFPDRAGVVLDVNSIQYRVLREDDLLAVLT